MLRALAIFLLPFLLLAQEPLCVNWLPVYLCPNRCFELDICHDTLNPGFVYDSVYVYSTLEMLATGGSGTWYDLTSPSPPAMPQICNQAYWDTGAGEWVFGWDSVYIRADTNGALAADTSIWVFHYPPDSGWVGAGGDTVCPASAGTLFAKWLQVRGALFWSFAVGTTVVQNDFPHCEVIETTVCIVPDHQAYWGPDTFPLSPSFIDSAFDPCPVPICTTFVLLPTDVVDDEFFVLCPDSCGTLLVQTRCYPYNHRWFWSGGSTGVFPGDTASPDTVVVCGLPCGTTWVYYEVTGPSCAGAIIDSFGVFVPCLDYELLVSGASADTFCAGDSVRVCLAGALCPDLDTSEVCWITPDGGVYCGRCVGFVADTSAWVFVNFHDCWRCEHSDSLFVPVYPRDTILISVSGRCAGDSVRFVVTNGGPFGIDSFSVDYGDGTWEFISAPLAPSASDTVSHVYPGTGIYKVFLSFFVGDGCVQTDSVWVRQSEVSAELSATPSPACRGGTVLLDASGSTVEPAGALSYTFIRPDGAVLCAGPNPFCVDSSAMEGVYRVVVTDSFCVDTASYYLEVKWAELSGHSRCVVSGCAAEVCVSGVSHGCEGELVYAYVDPATGDTVVLDGNCFTTRPIGDTVSYVVFAWCSDCPDSAARDSALVRLVPVDITATLGDTVLCYGDFIPNMLESVLVVPADTAESCDVVVKVEVDYGDCPECGEVLYDWGSADALPSVFPRPLLRDGVLIYRFAVAGDTSCAYEAVSRLTMRHPVAVLKAQPDTVVCEDSLICLNACESYSNCAGVDLCYTFFQVVDGVMIPLPGSDSACCCPDTALMDSCCYYCLPSPLAPGTYTYAVEVCVEGLPWCCDTATVTVRVCSPILPVLSFEGACSADTVLEGSTITGNVQNASELERVEWYVGGCPGAGGTLVGSGFTQSFDVPTCASLSTPCTTFTVCAVGYTCRDVCSACECRTFNIDCLPTVATSPCNAAATEDQMLVLDLISHCGIDDPCGDPFVCVLESGPLGVSVDSSCTLRWTPTNCDVGTSDVFISIENRPCGAATTMQLAVAVDNALSATVIDTSFGTSCIDTYSFARINDPPNPAPGTADASLTITGQTDCFDISIALHNPDEGDCSCGTCEGGGYTLVPPGASGDSSLYWVRVDSCTGVITMDHSHIPAGTYTGTIRYSDCHGTDDIALSINVPNHTPYVLCGGIVMVPAGSETTLVRLGEDVVDVDGDSMFFVDFSIENYEHYSVFGLSGDGGALVVGPAADYSNTDAGPDALRANVSDVWGNTVEVVVLVQVYEPGEVEVVGGKPRAAGICGAYPNPFNSSTWIEVESTVQTRASVEVYDVSGELVRRLFRGVLPVGVLRFRWNGKADDGRDCPSGQYFVVMKTERKSYSMPIYLVR